MLEIVQLKKKVKIMFWGALGIKMEGINEKMGSNRVLIGEFLVILKTAFNAADVQIWFSKMLKKLRNLCLFFGIHWKVTYSTDCFSMYYSYQEWG